MEELQNLMYEYVLTEDLYLTMATLRSLQP